ADQGRRRPQDRRPIVAQTWLPAGKASDLPPGRVRLVTGPDDQRLAVCNVDGEFYAIEDVCTHDGGSLDQGELEGEEIECPRHGARFDVRTGRATLMPAVMPVQTYAVRVDGNDLFVSSTPQGEG
ncbi:MAG TPA: non-heme iron oxygenase ferredoxin subunit, partial [Myxococcota bacterium]|nr:non-heme iron oxygenase ferredoxin subunit [Myxococcota bacterium]